MIAARSGSKPFSKIPPPAEEIPEAFALSPLMFAAYAGSYTLTDAKLISHIEACSVQNLVSTDQVRYVKLEGDRLMLRWETFP